MGIGFHLDDIEEAYFCGVASEMEELSPLDDDYVREEYREEDE